MERNGKFDSIEDVLVFNPEFNNRGNWFKFDGDYTYQNLIITDDSFEKPTQEFLESELKKQQDEFDSKQYQRDRLAEYPSIQELVVALYDEEDKASIIERRNAVKAKYPKPE